MTHRTETRDAIEAVVTHIQSLSDRGDAAAVARFARDYLANVDVSDISGYAVPDLCAAVLSHWDLCQSRLPGSAKLRVFNPQRDEHGWECPHTVVELVTDDMPFLVDSLTMEVNRRGLMLHLIIHPVMRLRRDATGTLVAIETRDHGGADAEGVHFESIIHLEVDRLASESELAELHAAMEGVLADVRAVVSDWQPMRERLAEIAAGMGAGIPVAGEEVAEARALIEWLLAENFVLLGCRDYTLHAGADGEQLEIRPGSGLGLLRETSEETRSRSFAALPPEVRALAHQPELLTVTKSNSRSTVHRTGYLDYIGVRTFDAAGRVSGERRILGLLASTAYSASPTGIPVLRRKIAEVTQRAGLLAGSHAAKALHVILERYPRDELFQIGVDELHSHAIGILRLGERQRTRLFVRCDPFGRFVSCLVYVPREHYDTAQRQRIQAVLMQTFDGVAADFDVQLSESPLARILFTVRTRDGVIPAFDAGEIEQRIVQVARRWHDELRQALVEAAGETRGLALYATWAEAFPAGYRERYPASVAVSDIERIEALPGPDQLGMSLQRPQGGPDGRLHFKLYRLDVPVLLSHGLRMLERMGVIVSDEQPSVLSRRDGRSVWIHDFGLSFAGAAALDIERLRPTFQDAFAHIWSGAAENDEFNRLVLLAGLGWREIAVLRAYARYLRQAAFPFSQAYMERALAAHPDIARLLVDLFQRRFDPAAADDRDVDCACITERITQALDAVANLDEDRILRQFLALIGATLRTNHFRRDAGGALRSYLSFKFDPAAIPGLPEPRPMFEIFVCSPRFEGVHLRGGRVARGGIRWSDRMEDFRTEVLGLVKAQIVKNAVIVPVGSKGGFVVRNPPSEGGREALMAEGVACYRLFLSGLLDLTDNIERGVVVPPPDVVRHDADDPYLVVAADKGTATFSDHANRVAAEYGFWLDDAFASGGSAGYDHKKMGITARGAWESVKRHFRELGVDVQTTPFTVAGIGDMSGDVFGNGMLLSKKICLVAAFDHRHIMIDPRPDPEASWVERARIFELPRSSWDDYDRSLISSGGGIWPRSVKSIPLSDEMRALLQTDAPAMTPSDLIRSILRAPVDLLYNGGIGTYIKAATESDAEVGDRANDAVRVNGGELRCKVLGEGGNLGATQRGRIEFALAGGRVYTDAIDNSGGVDCSDHEVNIKILLGSVAAEGGITREARDVLLADMTDEVAALVLRDNYAQGQILSLMQARGAALLDEQTEFMRRLAHAGRLNRKLEFLPLDEDIVARRATGKGLTTPELAVLLAYGKIELYDEVLASDVPEDPYVSTALLRYFPQPLRARHADHISRHPLRREIIATHVINSMMNRVGATFVSRVRSETGASSAAVVRAYIATREVFSLVPCWSAIEALDNRIPAGLQTEMQLALLRLVRGGTLWFLRNPRWLDSLDNTLAHFHPGVERLAQTLPLRLAAEHAEALKARTTELIGEGVPEPLATRVALVSALLPALDLVELAADGRDPETVARVYFALDEILEMRWLSAQIDALTSDVRWGSLARSALRVDLAQAARRLAADALALCADEPASEDGAGDAAMADEPACLHRWRALNAAGLERYRALMAEARGTAGADVAALTVLMRELRGLGAGG